MAGQTTSGYSSQQTTSSYGQGDGYRSTTTTQSGGTPFHQVQQGNLDHRTMMSTDQQEVAIGTLWVYGHEGAE